MVTLKTKYCNCNDLPGLDTSWLRLDSLLHASAELRRRRRCNKQNKKRNHETLSLVCLFRDPSTPPRPKSLFDLWNVIRFVPRNNQGLNIYNDCVLNKTIKLLFFLFKPSLRFFFNSFQSDHTCMLYIELFIIKDCTLIFQSTYYMYKWRADRDRSRFLLVKLSRNTSFFYYWKY